MTYNLQEMHATGRMELFRGCLAQTRAEAIDRGLITNETWDFLNEVEIQSRGDNKFVALSRDQPGRVSYARDVDDRYDDNRRIVLTLNRYLRRQCGDLSEMLNNGTIDESQIETACDIFRRIVTSITTNPETFFKILPASKIPALLHSIKEPAGVEMGSCMTGDSDLAESYKVFEKADGVKMECLIFDDGTGRNEHGRARAFLWTFPDGAVLMDRIYNNSGYHLQHFRNYAETRGIWQRENNSLPDDSVSFKRGDERLHKFTFKIPFPDCMPYMDSFSWARETGHGVEMQLFREEAELIFQSTSGGWDRCGVRCASCDESVSIDDRYEVDRDAYCADCYHDHYTDCARCGERESLDNAHCVHDEHWCQYCTDHHAIECDKCFEMVPTDDAEVWDENQNVCSSCRNS